MRSALFYLSRARYFPWCRDSIVLCRSLRCTEKVKSFGAVLVFPVRTITLSGAKKEEIRMVKLPL